MDNVSYALGVVIGQNLKQAPIKNLSAADFAAAVSDVLAGRPTSLSPQQAQQLVQQAMHEAEQQAGRQAREQGEKFLSDNAKRAGVTTTASGLQYEVLTPALGRKPTQKDTVRCHYEGRLTDGTVFDSSYRRGEPAEFPLSGVIAGWTEGLQLMAEGAKFRFFIPYQLAYGSRGAGGSIPPYAALVFDVELLKVKD